MNRRLAPGSPEPLGATLLPGGVNVAVFSAHASAIEFCLFDAGGRKELERFALPERTGDVFHAFIAGIEAGRRYGLRAHGPYDPQHGQRFNPAKLLVDPYATALDRRFVLHRSVFGEMPDGCTRNDADSAPFVPKAVLVAPSPRVRAGDRRIPWDRTVIYELHVRGYTKAHPEVPEAIRGTCAGLAHPVAIAHLVKLGITTVELMPVAAWVDERHLGPLGLANYWGYNPVALMVPDPQLAPGGMAELAACVAALHEAGIEVLLDVVLNHTGEGDSLGPTLSLRGLDNATYYRTLGGDGAGYANDAGCGNTLALERAPVLRLAMDALRHYAIGAGVDGFRFDLATTLARSHGGFDPAAPLLQAIAQDPVLRDLKLVAEPWDIGPDAHRLGAFPAGWGEWNDLYRDAVRSFWRGNPAMTGALATRLAGSADVFAARSRPPSRSVNFVCAHDGFTLADLVAHQRKHNEANGEGNRDGTDANNSWNHGVEGSSHDDALVAARRRDVRSLLATLFVSRGTPMLSMGDELGRTQGGNNNAYAQDNALAWVDWANGDTDLAGFVANLAALRGRHPALRADRWLEGEPADASAIPDVEWRNPDGRAMARQDWQHPHGRALVAVLYVPAEGGDAADRVAIALNAGHAPLDVCWPDARDGFRWRRAVDTAQPVSTPVPRTVAALESLGARTVVVLVEEKGTVRRSGIEPAVLDRLANAAGIAPTWRDVKGKEHVVGDDTRQALLAAMGLESRTTGQARERLHAIAIGREYRRMPRALVRFEGEPVAMALAAPHARGGRGIARIVAEDGTVRRVPFDGATCEGERVLATDGRTVARHLVALPQLPVGAHTVSLEDEPETCHLLVVPRRCFLPAVLREGRRLFGLAAHLYSLRRADDQGIGDFTTLAQAAEATARAGGSLVGINPLHALFPAQRDRASPYHPSDRRFLDALYIDVAAVPDFAASKVARTVLHERAAALARLASSPLVDYPGVWAVKRPVLEACFDTFVRRPAGDALVAEYRQFVAQGGERLRRFAAFESISASRPAVPWQRWPEELRRPDDPGVARFVVRNAREVDFAMYVQWLADRQLATAAQSARTSGLGIGFYRDLAVGAAPDGAEAWSTQSALARGVSIGAPPDPFCVAGQVWNLPPPLPEALAAGGFDDFRALIAANARHAGALRIDHVMGLARLFWIPDGATAAEGAYVRYPFEELLGALALESRRANCLIVGEDLGTVPEGFRDRLDAADVLSYRVLWFERDEEFFRAPESYPAKSVACVSTHDLPTIRGWCSAAETGDREALGLSGKDEVATAHALHRFIGETRSALALVQADDLSGEATPLNVPGTDRERPNWRRKVGTVAAQLWTTPVGAQAASDLAAKRGPRS